MHTNYKNWFIAFERIHSIYGFYIISRDLSTEIDVLWKVFFFSIKNFNFETKKTCNPFHYCIVLVLFCIKSYCTRKGNNQIIKTDEKAEEKLISKVQVESFLFVVHSIKIRFISLVIKSQSSYLVHLKVFLWFVFFFLFRCQHIFFAFRCTDPNCLFRWVFAAAEYIRSTL